VFGADFSAARDAGNRIWICRAHPGADGVRIESIDPLADLPGGVADRGAALGSLVQKVVESPRSAWGFDFCFGLPQPVATALSTDATKRGLTAALEAVAACTGADEFRRRCIEAADGAELRRRTDDEASTPFSPYNLRIYKQTFHGMNGVLKPLRGRAEIAVLPFDRLPGAGDDSGQRLPFHHAASGRSPHIYVMEVCPSSVLARLEYPRRGYKGSGRETEDLRRELLARLVDDGLVRPVARSLRDRVVGDAGGDALDAVLAAVGAWRGYRDFDHAALRADPVYAAEGFVYS
jgi:hypothetical protein